MRFFNLGASELVLIFVLAVLAIGPKETLRLVTQMRQVVQSVRGTFAELSAEVGRAATEVMEESADRPPSAER